MSRVLTVRRRYEARCDSIICRELIGCNISTEKGMKKAFMGNLLDRPVLSAAMSQEMFFYKPLLNKALCDDNKF